MRYYCTMQFKFGRSRCHFTLSCHKIDILNHKCNDDNLSHDRYSKCNNDNLSQDRYSKCNNDNLWQDRYSKCDNDNRAKIKGKNVSWWIEQMKWCFRLLFYTMKAELGRGQLGLMRWIFYETCPRAVSNLQPSIESSAPPLNHGGPLRNKTTQRERDFLTDENVVQSVSVYLWRICSTPHHWMIVGQWWQ